MSDDLKPGTVSFIRKPVIVCTCGKILCELQSMYTVSPSGICGYCDARWSMMNTERGWEPTFIRLMPIDVNADSCTSPETGV